MADLLGGRWVLVTAVRSQEREQVTKNVEQCGGVVVTSFSAKDPPHLVVTRSARSPKYRGLLRAHPHTPAVTPEWLAASLQAGQLLPYDSHRVGPFLGLVVCLSGLLAADKATLAAVVTAGGGLHSPALDKKCTHLVVNAPEGAKYNFAVENKISTVTTRWVEACVEAGHCQDEAPYATAAAAATPAPACLGAQRQLQPAHSLMDEATSLLAPAGSSDGSAVPPSAPAGDGTAAPLRRAPSRLQRGASAGDAPAWPGDAGAPAAAATLPPPPHAQQAAVDAAELDAQLGWDDSTPPFLDAVRLLPLGCTPGELRECLQLVRAGAAKRFADWRDDLNHLVVGSDLGAAEALRALDFLSTHRSCLPVSLDWLRQSVAAQRRLPPDGFLVPTSRLTQHRRRAPALEKLEAATSRGDRVEASMVAAHAGDLSQAPSSQLVAGALSGCYFTLAAVRGTEDEARALALIRESGGRVFTDTTLQRVADKGRAYAICPTSLLPQDATQLRGACPDFRLVEEQRRFTLFWLECSVEAGQPLRPSRAAPLYQPLPYALPLPGMEHVEVTSSSFDTSTRQAFARVVEVAGGRYSQAMTRKTTHLILAYAAGQKYDRCGDFGVVPVTPDWLVDTMQLGRLQPVERYHPVPPPPGARLAPTQGTATAAGGGTAAAAFGAAVAGEAAAAGVPTQALSPPQQAPPAAAPLRQRPQLVLPPPPPPPQPQPQQQQVQQQAGPPRTLSLRARMHATQAAAAAPARQQQQQQQQRVQQALPQTDRVLAGNEENASQGNNPPAPPAAPHGTSSLQPGGKPPSSSGLPPLDEPPARAAAAGPPPLQRQRSALDDAMASLDEGLRQQAAAAARDEAAVQQAPISGGPIGAAATLGAGLGGVPRQAGGAPPQAAAAATAASPTPPAARAPGGQPGRTAGHSSGRSLRSSSRQRPAGRESPLLQQQPQAAAVPPPQAPAGGSEPQEDIARAVDQLGSMLQALEEPARVLQLGTQLDLPLAMPPPPPRSRAAARGTPTPADSSLSGGSGGGSRGARGAKRPADDDGGGGRPSQLRRSGRGRSGGDPAEAPPPLEMSQQVGYADDSDAPPRRMATRGGDQQQLKRALVEAAAAGAGRQPRRTAAGRAADPFQELARG